jgi:ABC-type glycerol-3-phosphate transport system permease component
MNMERKEAIRYGIPLVLAIVIVTAVILLGLASQNPDGFEWSLFDFAGVTEPTGGFEGIWSFLGTSSVVDAMTGIIGIVVILLLGYGFFWITSRKQSE